MFGCEDQERPAVKRVGTRREYANFFLVIVDVEIDLGAFTFSDPIALEQFNSFRPIESLQLVQQSLGIRRDAKHPLPHRPAHDWETTDLALTIDNFLIR